MRKKPDLPDSLQVWMDWNMGLLTYEEALAKLQEQCGEVHVEITATGKRELLKGRKK